MNAKKVGLFLLQKMEEQAMAPEAKAALLLLEHAPDSDPRVLGATIEILEEMRKRKTMPVFVASALDLLIEHQKNPMRSVEVETAHTKRRKSKSRSISSHDSEYEDEEEDVGVVDEEEEEEEEESDAEHHWSAASDDEEEQESIVESSDSDNKRKRKEPDRFRHEDFEDDNSGDKGVDIGVDNPSNGILDALSRCLKVLDSEGYDEMCAKVNWWHKYFGAALKGVEDGCGRTGNAEFIREYIRIPCFKRANITFKAISVVKGTCALCNGTHECSVEMRLSAGAVAAAPATGTVSAPVVIEDEPGAVVAVVLGSPTEPSVPPKDKEEEDGDRFFLLGAYCGTLANRLLEFYMCLRDHNSFENRRKKFQALKNKLAAVVEAHSDKRRKI
jgi:hypothetical protein